MPKRRLWLAGSLVLFSASLAGVRFYKHKKRLKENQADMEKITADFEADQELIQYESKRLTSMIQKQLSTIDLEAVRKKAPYIMEKDVLSIQGYIQAGKLSYEELTAFYLDRMLQYDVCLNGLNAISEVNPNALMQARQCDTQKYLANNHPLFGIPITYKENILTKSLATSAGCVAFQNYVGDSDAGIVEKLSQAGAILLGKTNLSELANFMDPTMPSGYSGKHGQTLNPYGPLRFSPLGSSSGAASSIATNIGCIAIGSETTGSITAPAAFQSLVGYKPSKGVLPEDGVFPLSSSLDVVGPISKTVKDAILVFNASSQLEKINVMTLDAFSLAKKKIGLVKSNHPLQDKLRQALEALQVEVIEVTFDESEIDNLQIIYQDLATDFKEFTKRHHYPIQDLSKLVAFNRKNLPRNARYGQRLIEVAASYQTTDRKLIVEQIQLASHRLNMLRQTYQLDAFVSFNYDKVLLPAVAGYPELTVPFAFDEQGLPQGATFIGFKDEDADLLKIGYAFEQRIQGRRQPDLTLLQQIK